MLPPRHHLDWPFFDESHRGFGRRLDAFVASGGVAVDHNQHGHSDVDAACVELVARLGRAGLLDAAVARPGEGVAALQSRMICLARETLAFHDGLADFAFAMQGLGSGAIALGGTPEMQAAVLPEVRAGRMLAAFALSEANAGSDVAAMATSAVQQGDDYILDGEKTWISNGGIAGVYCVFARTGEAAGARGLSAFVVFPQDKGFSIARRIDVIAPHPLATIRFDACRIPRQRLIGAPGEGFKIAMRTLDIFRASVAGAALGFARRAYAEALDHARQRRMFGATLADLQLTQAAIGDMATEIDAAALLTARAAWQRDVAGTPTTAEAAMAKMAATESAQRVIDRAVQMFGGRGVQSGEMVEKLYREIRALRIYEGATEVQKLIIAREAMRQAKE